METQQSSHASHRFTTTTARGSVFSRAANASLHRIGARARTDRPPRTRTPTARRDIVSTRPSNRTPRCALRPIRDPDLPLAPDERRTPGSHREISRPRSPTPLASTPRDAPGSGSGTRRERTAGRRRTFPPAMARRRSLSVARPRTFVRPQVPLRERDARLFFTTHRSEPPRVPRGEFRYF